MILSIAPSVFAEGSWKLNCVSDKGVTISSENGDSSIRSSKKSEAIAIENYDLGFSDTSTKLKWIGSPVVVSETSENSCNTDHVITTFKQKANITRNGKTTLVNLVCTDSVITSAGSESSDCL